MLGLQIFILCNKKIDKSLVKLVEVEEIKLGSLKIGNKGGIQVILQLGKSFLSLINCHLAPGYGPEAVEARMNHLFDLLAIK